MPFEFGDQPDYYTTALMPRYWDLCSADMEVSAGDGFGGADAWTASDVDAYAVKFPASVDTTRFGFVVRLFIDTLPAAPAIIVGAADAPDVGSPTTPRIQVCCALNADGTVSIYRGDVATGTLLAASVDVLPTGDHLRIGFSGVIDPVSGSATVSLGIDGEPDERLLPIVQVGVVSTDATGTGVRRGVHMGGTPDLFTSLLYTQGAGTLPTDPRVDVLMPVSDTDLQEFEVEPAVVTPVLADVVDDNPANDDTDYGFAQVTGLSYALTHGTLPSRVQILGVRTVATVENETNVPPWPTTFTPLVRASSGAVSLGTPQSVGEDWVGRDHSFPVNPFTGLPWTTATVNDTGYGGVATP